MGLGIARRLAECGFRTIVIARSESAELAKALRDANAAQPGSLHFVPFDLAKIEGISDLVKKLRKDLGPIYGLVNNAGVSSDGALALMSTRDIEQMVRLNTTSPIVLTKHVVGRMMADGGGRIINVSSIVGSTGYKGLAAYAATKASMVGFTRSLAREVGSLGITVNAVAPGFLETEMTEGLTGKQHAQVVRRSALGRMAEVEDVANAVDYLLGDKGRNITGTVLTIDAGSTA